MTTDQTSRSASTLMTSISSSLGGSQTTETRPQAISRAPATERAPGGDQDTRQAKGDSAAILPPPAGADSRPTMVVALPSDRSSGGTELAGRQPLDDTHRVFAASDQAADRQDSPDDQSMTAVGTPGPAAKLPVTSTDLSLLDPALALAADVLDDTERVRIANENRLRQLTRSVEDSDGEVRGFGLDESHPDVARLAAIVAMLGKVYDDATKHLEKVMRRHPLHAWAKSMRGVGDKQIARLLAAIGDPYWRPEIVREDGTVVPAGPRTVSALWAYCGLHTLPVGHAGVANQFARADGANFPASHANPDAQAAGAGRDQLAARHPGQRESDAQDTAAWVAARRQRGTKANWSTTAKTRAYLIAESCVKQLVKPCTTGAHVEDCACGQYRLVYEARRATTVDRLHAVPCVRCGPAGKPAQPGTPWSDGHKHADALRIVSKRILRDLWREARRIHQAALPGHLIFETQTRDAGQGTPSHPNGGAPNGS